MSRLFDRIGVDINQKLPLEAAVDWTVKHKVPLHRPVPRPDPGAAARHRFLPADAARKQLEKAGIEDRPAHALRGQHRRDLAVRVRGGRRLPRGLHRRRQEARRGWIVVHGGYHFTSDKKARMDAAVARVARAAKLAERRRPGSCSRTSTRSRSTPRCITWRRPRRVQVLLRPPRLARARLELHREPRAHPAEQDLRVHDRPRHEALRRGAPRRLPRHARGAPEARRGHDRLSRDVRRDREERLPRALHAGLRQSRRHAEGTGNAFRARGRSNWT